MLNLRSRNKTRTHLNKPKETELGTYSLPRNSEHNKLQQNWKDTVHEVDAGCFIIYINLDCNLIKIFNEPVVPKQGSRIKVGPKVSTEGCKRW
jgi:hypothetical protein